MTEDTQTPAEKRHMWARINRRIIAVLLVILLFWPMVALIAYGVHVAYDAVDPMRFPTVSEPLASAVTSLDTASEIADEQKAQVMVTAMQSQLRRELDSTFGWSVNDLLISPTSWLDNRANRQRGVIFATRMLVNFFSPNVAKLGPADKENADLKEVRERRIVYGEDIWGFFRVSAEREYGSALDAMEKYKADVQAGDAVYNMRSDDIYNALVYIVGENFLGQAMGLLIEPNEQVGFNDLDNRIYYSQGAVLVVRDFLYGLTQMYPEIAEKGGEENLAAAFTAMDKICTFYPVIVLRGQHDSLLADHRGKVARYLITVQSRINDIAQSIRR